MNRTKVGLIVLAALIIAALLTLTYSKREVYIPWVMPKTIVLPPKPASVPVKPKIRVREKRDTGVIKAPGAAGKPVKKRKKRVSRLREPGEALGGGVQLDLPDKTTGRAPQKK